MKFKSLIVFAVLISIPITSFMMDLSDDVIRESTVGEEEIMIELPDSYDLKEALVKNGLIVFDNYTSFFRNNGTPKANSEWFAFNY